MVRSLFLALTLAGCSSGSVLPFPHCPEMHEKDTFTIRVLDATTSAPVCHARITVTPDVSLTESSCTYVARGVGGGSYTIHVDADGYEPGSGGVFMKDYDDGCGAFEQPHDAIMMNPST
ncbi:MAG: carboxypeptidase-like regulatory domain-containing protein [Polyangiales bacterium]